MTVRSFSFNVCQTLVSMYGTPQPGEAFASSVSFQEFLLLMQRVKDAAVQFSIADLTHDGSISAAELAVAMRQSGQNLPDIAIQGMLVSHDYDRDGRIAFDEFLQMLLEAEMFHMRMRSTGME